MKRTIAWLVLAAILLGAIAAVPTVFADDTEDGVLELLSELSIMRGDPDGNMRLDDYVSRAEFTKMAVASSEYKNSVATNLAISPFPDVTYQHWAAPYVRVGVTNGLISGYPDATFKPDNTVLYEEGITILLRVLGYDDGDFGVSWPSGQIGLADNLDITDGLNCAAGDTLNRRQVAQLIFNTLKTTRKGQQSDLISVFDSAIYKDTTLVATAKEDSAVASDEIFTSSGTFKISEDFDSSRIGMRGDAIVNDASRLIAFVPESAGSEPLEYIVYSVLGDKVMAYRNDAVSQIEINDDTLAYKGETKTTFGNLKAQLQLGDRLIVRKGKTGSVDYVTYGKGNINGPVTALNGSYKATWNIGDDVSVTRNGISCTMADIRNYDVVYYLKDLNMVLAYSNKVTGIYEKATPNRDVPISVTVSGKEYEIEGSAAFNKLYSGGNFEYGDTVTLLLGRDNKIADVVSPSASSDGVVGYLTETGIKEYSSGDIDIYTNYYIKIVQPDGISYEYVTDRDYSESVNSVVKISFQNGYARVSHANASNGATGKVDWSNKRIGTTKLSPQVEILDVGTTNSVHQAIYVKTYGQRIDGVTLTDKSVIYAEKNSSGEISKLILNNVTNDSFSYGLVTGTKVKEAKNDILSTSQYEYIVGGNRYSIDVNGSYSVNKNSVAKIYGNPSKPDSMISINQVQAKITSMTADKLIAGNVTYKISDKVSVYKRESLTAYDYSMMSLQEVVDNMDDYSISAFYDKSTETGGRVRVIVVTEE